MHELSVVFHTIKLVNEIAKENGIEEISEVTVEIGEVSTVIPYYFQDCYEWAIKKEPVLKNSKLTIEIQKAITTCLNCGKEYATVDYGKTCPFCKSDDTVLKEGNGISIKSIAVKEE